jgi:hypothetical protein
LIAITMLPVRVMICYCVESNGAMRFGDALSTLMKPDCVSVRTRRPLYEADLPETI